MAWYSTILGPLVEGVNGWFQRRHELKIKKHDLKKAELEGEIEVKVAEAKSKVAIAEKRAQADIDWELESIRNSGWKDEYITILFTLPAAAIFIPYAQDYVESGFERLASTPVWYQTVLFGIVGSALGIRIWDAFIKPLTAGKKTT